MRRSGVPVVHFVLRSRCWGSSLCLTACQAGELQFTDVPAAGARGIADVEVCEGDCYTSHLAHAALLRVRRQGHLRKYTSG
jgi:hypothetical protein